MHVIHQGFIRKQNLEEKKHQYVVEWIYDEGVPLTKKADIELGIVVL